MEDAVKQISGIIEMFKEIKRISIASKDDIILVWIDLNKDNITKNVKEKYFTSTIELLEWCEENLTAQNL